MNTTSAVITGGGRGIGFAIAARLAAAGHRVVITDIDGEAAVKAAREIGHGAVGIRQDVRDIVGHREVATKAASLGELAIWVNNAGILIAGDSWTHADDDLATILDINIRGALAGSNAAVQAMRAKGGRILNIASISALAPVPGLAAYAATKAAVLSFTTSLQGDLDHAGLPIKVKALCPDVVGTRMVSDRAADPGAAMLFAGPKHLDADAVAKAGLVLLESRQVFSVLPRWRGVVARTSDMAPTLGLAALGLIRKLGDRAQAEGMRPGARRNAK